MKTILLSLFSVFFLASFSSCSSSDDEVNELTKEGPFNISELAGDFEATKAQFSVNTVSVDVVELGGTVEMTVQSSGRFTLTIDPIDRVAYTVSGEMFWEAWQGSYFFAIVWDDEPGVWDTFGHTWDGNILTLNGGTDSGEYDFDNDGAAEPCTLHFIFERT